uniref:EXPERA domain-containing protein n=1 Tax=Melanopsichium pennsylvanicum 4 TaxID=1398559 RepID=A0A077QSN5_9BASI|nr:conserved hypothetical protein [Melanopsichium pennsylvanicum 4]
MSSTMSRTTVAENVAVSRPKTLTERPIDVLYLAYFGIHLLASIAVDAQLTYPPYSQRLFPQPLRKVLSDYMSTSGDPFLAAAARGSGEHVWFRVLLMSETFVQIPFFVMAIWGLLNDEKRTYPLMVGYGTLVDMILRIVNLLGANSSTHAAVGKEAGKDE